MYSRKLPPRARKAAPRADPPQPARPYPARQRQRQRRRKEAPIASGREVRTPAAGPSSRGLPAPSSETALTGPVRQRQAAAATRQPPPHAPATCRPRPRRPLNRQATRGPGDPVPPASRVARSAIAAGDATKERPLREADGPRTIGSRFQGKPRKQPPPDKSAIAQGQPSAQAPARPRPGVKPQVTGPPKPVSASQPKVRNPRR